MGELSKYVGRKIEQNKISKMMRIAQPVLVQSLGD